MNWREEPDLNRLSETVAQRAMTQNVRLGTAESCTGGLIAHLLTRTAGISQVFMGGIVAYSNSAKHEILAVPTDLLEAHGAVSDPVARAMARGARACLHVDVAVSTTGIAGPAGGSDEKPVGLVYVALLGPSTDSCSRFRFSGSRADIVMAAAYEALMLLDSALYTEMT
jgi:PncC family amidohydrolase